jgi:hypothetical protein
MECKTSSSLLWSLTQLKDSNLDNLTTFVVKKFLQRIYLSSTVFEE